MADRNLSRNNPHHRTVGAEQ